MANIKLPIKELEKHLGKIDEKMQMQIAMFGTPVESVTKEEIELEIFPNRPDLLSLHGFLRGFLAFLGKNMGLKQYKINPPEKDFEVKIDKSVKTVRPFTACAIVKNLSFDDEKIKEIIDIQEKLHNTIGRNRKKVAIGIYPLEKITLPITYKAEDPEQIVFVPLEASKKMNAKQILRQHPTGREYADLLKDAKKFPVFVDAKNEVLSMPPIINSQHTGKIEKSTKEVFIECSGFDFEILKKVLNIIITLLAEQGGKVYEMNLDYGKKVITPDLTPQETKINLSDANKLIGLDFNEQDIKKLLERMGHEYKSGKALSPAWRTDILHPVDIYEDIAIAYGYDKISPEMPEISSVGFESKEEVKKRKISEILTGLGFLEVSSFHLMTKKEAKKMGLKNLIEVETSKTDYTVLRPNLLGNCLKILSGNVDAKYPQKIFEIGKVFEKESEKIIEKEKLCIAVSGETNFTEMKQTLDYLMRMLSKTYKIENHEELCFIDGRTGKIISDGREIGYFGEVSPYTLKNWHLKMPTVVLEIYVEHL